MARKGVLISDPSVEAMTHGQWMFEAMALRKREEQEAEDKRSIITNVFQEATRAFRETLISLLGLHIGAGAPEEGKPTPYIPLALLTGRPEVMEEMLKRHEEQGTSTGALENEGLDALNDELMNLDMGDLEPLLSSGANSNDPFERWYSPEVQDFLQDIGVDVVGTDAVETVDPDA